MAAVDVMKELERASQIALAPPDVVTPEQRQAAENVILAFRKTKMPYANCRFILENSSVDYVLFQAATTIKEAVVREWPLLNASDVESLRSFLLRYITKHISLQSYVREQILQTVAVILKRGTLDSSGHSCDCLFQDVTELINSGNVTMQLVACSMLSALLNEYSSSSRTSSVGFTWEFHTKCKQAFEQDNLKRVFMFTLQILHEIETATDPLTREVTAVLNRVLSIAEQILSWEFTPRSSYARSYAGSFSSNQNVSLRPNEAWRDVLLGDETLHLFFRIFRKVRHNSEMAHHGLMCLSQLASLNGHIFPDDKARTQYLTQYLEGFLQLLLQVDLQDYEHLGVAMAFKNLTMMFPLNSFVALPESLLQSLISYLTTLTCNMGQAAAQEEALDPDDTLHTEAYEKLLDTWLSLVTDAEVLPSSLIKPHASQVFNSYMVCHLGPPHGSRSKTDASETEEIGDTEEDDRDKFADQLCSIGALARLVPDQSLPLMASVLEDLVGMYNKELMQLQEKGHTDLAQIHSLQEDIHWTLLVTAHILTEGVDGETPLVPSSIMEFSIAQGSTINLQTTLQVLAAPSQPVAGIPGALGQADTVIRLTSDILRVCDVEVQASTSRLVSCLSPQVASSSMWCLRRWAAAYLLPNENYYAQISPALNAAFGRESEGGRWMVDYLLQKIASNVMIWNSELQVMTDTLSLFVTMVDNKVRSNFVSNSKYLWHLARVEADTRGPARNLSSDARRLFMKGLVMAGTGLDDPDHLKQFWELVLKRSQDAFYAVVNQENFATQAYQGSSKDELTWVLDSLIGMAQGTRIDICERLFAFLHPLLIDIVRLLEVYHSYEDMVYLILELFAEVVRHHLCYLGESNSKKLFEVSLAAIQMYSKYHKGRDRTTAADEEENKFNDISVLMELLLNLLAKDFIDFGPEEDPTTQNGGHLEAVNVVLYGLDIIVPLMNSELLKFPSLCLQYYKLLAFLAEIHSDKFSSLSPSLFQNVMASIELGLSSFGPDITKLCLEVLTGLATQVFQAQCPGSQLSQAAHHFLGVVFHLLLLESFDLSLMDTASTALFCLICCHRDRYQELVNQLLEQQDQAENKQRLLEAFTSLTPQSLSLTIARPNKIAFKHNFDNFITNVRGFLCVR